MRMCMHCSRTFCRVALAAYQPKPPVTRPQLDLTIPQPASKQASAVLPVPSVASGPTAAVASGSVASSGNTSNSGPHAPISVGSAVRTHYLAKAAAKYTKALSKAKASESSSVSLRISPPSRAAPALACLTLRACEVGIMAW